MSGQGAGIAAEQRQVFGDNLGTRHPPSINCNQLQATDRAGRFQSVPDYAEAQEKFREQRNFLATVELRLQPTGPASRRPARKNPQVKRNLALGEVTEQVMKELKPQSKAATGTNKGGLNAEIQSRIGHQLRAMYDDVVRQGIPDRFAELIRKLDVVDGPQAVASSASGSAAMSAKNDGRD